MMEEFPSDTELKAASALLLLSCNVFSSTSAPISKMEEEEDPVKSTSEFCEKTGAEFSCLETSVDTTPCLSSLTADDYVQADSLNVVGAPAGRCCEIKFKVARRARSKVIYRDISDRKVAPISPPLMKPKPVEVAEPTDSATITTEGSCLSSGGSSEITSGKSRRREGRERKGRQAVAVAVAVAEEKAKRRKEVGSYHIRRRAEAIMRLLSGGECASEVRIRQLLGDSPDTSKALRMLLRMEEVKRFGVGGRSDPFIYTIAAKSETQ